MREEKVKTPFLTHGERTMHILWTLGSICGILAFLAACGAAWWGYNLLAKVDDDLPGHCDRDMRGE